MKQVGVVLGALCLGACGHHSEQGSGNQVCVRLAPKDATGPRVATYDDGALSAGEVKERMNAMPPSMRATFQATAQKRMLVDRMAELELLTKDAIAQGLQNDPDVVRALKSALAQKAMRKEMASRNAAATQQEISAYFNQHRQDYNRPEQLHAYAVFVGSAKDAQAVEQKARALKPMDYAGFQALADTYLAKEQPLLAKLDPPRAPGPAAGEAGKYTRLQQMRGDLGLRTPEDVQRLYGPEVAQALAKLSGNGEVTPPVKTAQGYWVLKLAQRMPAVTRTQAEVEPQIRARLAYERQQTEQAALIKELQARFHYHVDEAALSSLAPDAPTPGGAAPGLPPGMMPVRQNGAGPLASQPRTP